MAKDKASYKLKRRQQKYANKANRRAYKTQKRTLKNENKANKRQYRKDTLKGRTIRSLGAQSIGQAGGIGTAALTTSVVAAPKEKEATSGNKDIDTAVDKLLESLEEETTLKTSNEDAGSVQPGFKTRLFKGRISR